MGAELTPILVAFCNNSHMTSLAHRLRMLWTNLAGDERKRLVLVRDPRLPISPGARKTREYLEKLEAAGARLVRPNPEAVAALDAIRRLLAMAQSGDLVNGSESLKPQTVREWLATNLPGAVRKMMDELDGASIPPPNELDAILELLQEKLVISAEESARHTGLSLEQLEIDARANPDQIGYLAGPPALMFYVAPATSGGLDEQA
jgi:hypothetical protein